MHARAAVALLLLALLAPAASARPLAGNQVSVGAGAVTTSRGCVDDDAAIVLDVDLVRLSARVLVASACGPTADSFAGSCAQSTTSVTCRSATASLDLEDSGAFELTRIDAVTGTRSLVQGMLSTL